jgi:hypothetical protein
LFRYCQGIIDLNAKAPNRAFDFGMAKQELNGPQVAGTPVDKGCLRSTKRMRSEQAGIQPDAANPSRDQTRILSRGHCSRGTTSTTEQELA